MEEETNIVLSHNSFQRALLNGNPCIMVYDDTSDRAMIIDQSSKYFVNAMAAIEILSLASVPYAPESKEEEKASAEIIDIRTKLAGKLN